MTSSELAIMQGRLDRLQTIPVGWDGANAVPVHADCVAFGRTLLEACGFHTIPIPVTVPTGDAGLQLNWHNADYEIEIIILGTQNGTARRVNFATGQPETRPLTDPVAALAAWLVAP